MNPLNCRFDPVGFNPSNKVPNCPTFDANSELKLPPLASSNLRSWSKGAGAAKQKGSGFGNISVVEGDEGVVVAVTVDVVVVDVGETAAEEEEEERLVLVEELRLVFLREPPPTGMFLRAPPLVQYLLQLLQKWRG